MFLRENTGVKKLFKCLEDRSYGERGIVKNSDLMKSVMMTLLAITSRRSSESLSMLLVDTILKTLKRRYPFLEYVTIQKNEGFQSSPGDMIVVDPKIDEVDQTDVAKVIESMIRVIVMDLKEKAGLFFVKELRERLGDNYIDTLKGYQVDFDLMQLEIDYAREQQKRRMARQIGDESRKQEPGTVLGYNWESVANWRYDGNVCILYDKNGKVLDKLFLDQIVEHHVRTITESQELFQEIEQAAELTDEHKQLLKILYSKDIDMEEAQYYLKKTEQQIEDMIHDLVSANYLSYVSNDMVSITKKGVDFLLSSEEAKLDEKAETKRET
jgi:hypothetical protein